MMKSTTAAAKIQARIAAAIKAAATIAVASFRIDDNSVHAEQRLWCSWSIRYQFDRIDCKADLANTPGSNELWQLFRRDDMEILSLANLHHNDYFTAPVNLRTKTGPAHREDNKARFIVAQGRMFLASLKASLAKSRVKKFAAEVASIQAQQKQLLQAMRKSNADYLASRKTAKAAERAADAAALESGEFWNATPEAIKAYFHPPFAKNHLADVSAPWRAALFLECESTGWKDYRGNWRHKLVGTGNAWLCGIDDNGDEWGHAVAIALDHDQHGNLSLDATVEEAIAELFDVEQSRLSQCTRQGDLLFRPCRIRTTTETVCAHCGCKESEHISARIMMDGAEFEKYCYYVGSLTYRQRILSPPHLEAETEWTVRESHTIKSPSLRHNGRYFVSADEIRVEHTSHQPVILPAGEYCLHTLSIAAAD